MNAASNAVAGGAVAVAWWQARVAKEATDAQLKAQREQQDRARGERDRADCPQFIMQETDVRRGEGEVVEVVAVLKQTAGSDLDEARVTVHLNHERAHVIGGADDGTFLWLHTGTNALRHLKLLAQDVHCGHGGQLEIRADLVCRETGGGRTWTCRVFGYPQAEWEQILGSVASSSPSGPVGDTEDADDAGDAGDAEDMRDAGDADDVHGLDAPEVPDAPVTRSAVRVTPTPTPPGSTPFPVSPRRRERLPSLAHWRTTLPHPADDASRPPYPDVLQPTLVHPEDVGLLAVTPVLTSSAGRRAPEDDIW
ncbi:hypothetical protein [Streptomyces formicae]